MEYKVLNNGLKMPMVGLGVYNVSDQKRNVYIHSVLDWQRDDIEYAIASYVDDMNVDLYDSISGGIPDFLRDHRRFQEDITQAVERLEEML